MKDEIQHLLVCGCGPVTMTVELDWKHHLFWFEVHKGAEVVKCRDLFEAHVEYNRRTGKD